MDNYARALEYARGLFLKWDQQKIIARCKLRHDDHYLYLNFLGEPWRIERASGTAQRITNETTVNANFSEGLSIYDYLCGDEPFPALSGRFCPVNSLPHVAQSSSPSTGDYHQRFANDLQEHIPALKKAVARLGIAPFPKGDIACLFPVFDGFNVVFQFWEGDEDFPPSVCFLWDENTLGYLKYETTYYVMGCFLEKLQASIAEIEKNS